MFCPECGTENARNQKYCTRCGSSLFAVEYARSIVQEMTTGNVTNGLEASTVLKIVAGISIVGFLLITIGTILLALAYHDFRNGPPLALFFSLGGFASLVLIVRSLLKLIGNTTSAKPKVTRHTAPLTTPVNRSIAEGNPIYYSVTEEHTRQLENQR